MLTEFDEETDEESDRVVFDSILVRFCFYDEADRNGRPTFR